MIPSRKAQFEQVVRAYANDLFRYLYWLCRERAQAEDLVQEVFARAWAAWEDQRDEKAVKAWLFTIARNEHARLYERRRLDVDEEAELVPVGSVGSEPPPQEARSAAPSTPRARDRPRVTAPSVALRGPTCNVLDARLKGPY